MDQGIITCAKCGHEFALSDALTVQIRAQLKTELQADVLKRETEAKRRLDEVKQREGKLDQAQKDFDEEVDKQLKQKLTVVEAKAAKRVESQFTTELANLKESLKERDDSIKDYQANELELRKKQRELAKTKQEVELEIQRTLDDERENIRKNAESKSEEQHQLKDLERDKLIRDLKTSLDEMKRKASQGSMETQGEVLEQEFEGQLKRYFVHDDIQPVPKGIRGADVIQTVQTPMGDKCGSLLWETKNTKSWGAKWIPKLKDDAIEVRASIPILVSVVLPDGVNRFGMLDGVWVSDHLSAIPLAAALREQLISIDRERRVSAGKGEKMAMLYEYLAGTEFKQKIEGIVDAFTSMQNQIISERRVMEKHWKMREKQIERVMKNTVGLYGDMQGIIGGQIPEIPALALDAPAADLLLETQNGQSIEEDI